MNFAFLIHGHGVTVYSRCVEQTVLKLSVGEIQQQNFHLIYFDNSKRGDTIGTESICICVQKYIYHTTERAHKILFSFFPLGSCIHRIDSIVSIEMLHFECEKKKYRERMNRSKSIQVHSIIPIYTAILDGYNIPFASKLAYFAHFSIFILFLPVCLSVF